MKSKVRGSCEARRPSLRRRARSLNSLLYACSVPWLLLVPEIVFTGFGLAILLSEAIEPSEYATIPYSVSVAYLAGGLPALAAGIALVAVGKKMKRRAISAAREEMVFSTSPSFAQGRPGAQLGFQF